MTPARLLLPDGSLLAGTAHGATTTRVGELCFNTALSGYQEVFTDPSYAGQIVVMTQPHVGNYGTLEAEAQSNRVHIAGLVCRSFSEVFSRPGQQGTSLQRYLAQNGVPVLAGVDTRSLVKTLRGMGAVNAALTTENLTHTDLQQAQANHPGMDGLELASLVSTPEPYELGSGPHQVVVLDYGVKTNILTCLAERGCRLKVLPAKTPAAELLALPADGYFLSNGPGDPAAMDYAVEQARALVATRKPVFGICLGHQVLARAFGLPTFKMKYGHRGVNHPVQNLLTGRSEMTAQNHGFAVDRAALEAHPELQLTHVHLNDHTVMGLRHRELPVFAVQYHPEACPGPHDSRYLFDAFVALLRQT